MAIKRTYYMYTYAPSVGYAADFILEVEKRNVVRYRKVEREYWQPISGGGEPLSNYAGATVLTALARRVYEVDVWQ